jgi:4-hydroxybenzoate polyprenyltransferase
MIVLALLRASHLGPTVLVTAIAFFVATFEFTTFESLQIAFAVFAGQLVVGWSNDVIDFPLDTDAKRTKKPLVAGEISLGLLQKLIPVALVSATLISLISPLGLSGTLVHLLGLLSATLYNLKLKSTIFSPLPYIISFGALPWAIFLAAGTTPPPWLYLALALFTTAFHFLNVVKDLQWDIEQGVLGLPQRIGKTPSLLTASILVIAGLLTCVSAGTLGIV